jgi:2-oxoisovalerate dehydrogenase E1 component
MVLLKAEIVVFTLEQEYKIIGMISHLGPQLGVADGIALANKLQKKRKSNSCIYWRSATSEGDFHEALNIASVWELPVLFVENNGYGLSTPPMNSTVVKTLLTKKGYGMESHIVDGNYIRDNLLSDLKASMKLIHVRFIKFKTFRMRGHEGLVVQNMFRKT